jgi:hypothetical protein
VDTTDQAAFDAAFGAFSAAQASATAVRAAAAARPPAQVTALSDGSL